MTIYADVLLLVNFSMDFLTLYFTGRLLHRPMRKGRLIAAAAAASAGGTVRTILGCGTNGAAGIVLSVLMTLIAFGKGRSVSDFLKVCLSVWGSGIFLGGIMTFLLALGENVTGDENQISAPFFAVFLICFAAASGLNAAVGKRGQCSVSAEVSVKVCGEVKRITMLCDSGNLASEPLTGLAVIFVGKGVLPYAEEEMKKESCGLRIRVVPISGMNGDSVHVGFIPEGLTVNGTNREAVIVILNEKSTFGGYDGIVPAVLC